MRRLLGRLLAAATSIAAIFEDVFSKHIIITVSYMEGLHL